MVEENIEGNRVVKAFVREPYETEKFDEHVIDHKGGSWFHQLDKNNHVIGTVWPGKSDLYHAFRGQTQADARPSFRTKFCDRQRNSRDPSRNRDRN